LEKGKVDYFSFHSSIFAQLYIWPYRLSARTEASQASKRGSIPRRVTPTKKNASARMLFSLAVGLCRGIESRSERRRARRGRGRPQQRASCDRFPVGSQPRSTRRHTSIESNIVDYILTETFHLLLKVACML
jgi:hypothetical protein